MFHALDDLPSSPSDSEHNNSIGEFQPVIVKMVSQNKFSKPRVSIYDEGSILKSSFNVNSLWKNHDILPTRKDIVPDKFKITSVITVGNIGAIN